MSGFFFFFFLKTLFLCNCLGCPRTHVVNKVGLVHKYIFVPLPPQCWDLRMCATMATLFLLLKINQLNKQTEPHFDYLIPIFLCPHFLVMEPYTLKNLKNYRLVSIYDLHVSNCGKVFGGLTCSIFLPALLCFDIIVDFFD